MAWLQVSACSWDIFLNVISVWGQPPGVPGCTSSSDLFSQLSCQSVVNSVSLTDSCFWGFLIYQLTFSGAGVGGVQYYHLSFAVSMSGTQVVMLVHQILGMQPAPFHCSSNDLVLCSCRHKGWSTSWPSYISPLDSCNWLQLAPLAL